MQRTKVLVIGAGLAGLAASKRLSLESIDHVIVDKDMSKFGHAKTHEVGGYRFDEGPHLLFSDDKEMLKFAGSPEPETYKSTPKIRNMWNGRLMNHPAQLHFSEMGDSEKSISVAKSLVEVKQINSVNNYREWVQNRTSPLVYELFHKVYTEKYWRTDPADMDIDWLGGGRVFATNEKLRESINAHLEAGTLPNQDLTEGAHYLKSFTYDEGGFERLFPSLSTSNVVLGAEVQKLDIANSIASTSKGEIAYEAVISTMPIMKVSEISNVGTVDDNKLKWTRLRLDNYVVKQNHEFIIDETWIYNYDEASSCSRLSFPDNFLSIEPRREHRVQFETYLRNDEESDLKDAFLNAESILRKYNVIPAGSELKFVNQHFTEFANVIPMRGWQTAAGDLRNQLETVKVWTAGRFGAWQYLWSVDSIKSGFEAAEKVICYLQENILNSVLRHN